VCRRWLFYVKHAQLKYAHAERTMCRRLVTRVSARVDDLLCDQSARRLAGVA
jgi:hypothetical protein